METPVGLGWWETPSLWAGTSAIMAEHTPMCKLVQGVAGVRMKTPFHPKPPRKSPQHPRGNNAMRRKVTRSAEGCVEIGGVN